MTVFKQISYMDLLQSLEFKDMKSLLQETKSGVSLKGKQGLGAVVFTFNPNT